MGRQEIGRSEKMHIQQESEKFMQTTKILRELLSITIGIDQWYLRYRLLFLAQRPAKVRSTSISPLLAKL